MKGMINMFRNALALAVLAVSGFAADASLIGLVPPEAKVIGGIHIDRTVTSPFGQYVLSQVKDSDKDFQQFVTATGFDPRRDLREVIFASPAAGQHGPGLIIARGVFNGPQILTAVQTKNGGTLSTYQGVSLLEHDGHGIAIADGSLGIAGEANLVRAALDRRSATAGAQTALAAKAIQTSNKYDAWMVTSGVFVAPLPGRRTGSQSTSAIAGPNLEGILETSGGLTFGTLVDFKAEALTRSDQDAKALADVLKFLASMVQMGGDKNPETQTLQTILQSLNVQTSGSTVQMSFSIPEQDLEKLFPTKKSVRAGRSAPRN